MAGKTVELCAGRERVLISEKAAAKLFQGRRPEDLGFGSHACVYDAGNNQIVKVTMHEPDAAAALALKARPTRGAVRVYDVTRLGDYFYGYRAERMPPLGTVARIVQQCARSTNLAQAFIDRFKERRRAPAAISPAMDACLVEGGRRFGMSPTIPRTFAKRLVSVQAGLSSRTGIHWFDVSEPGNFTQDAKGNPVIVDFGMSVVPPQWSDALKRKASLRGRR